MFVAYYLLQICSPDFNRIFVFIFYIYTKIYSNILIMRYIERDLKKIARFGERRELENVEFRTFLKGLDYEEVDEIVRRLNEEIIPQIDCRECGNCCHSLRPGLNDQEIEHLAQLEQIPKDDYIRKYMEEDEFDDELYLKDMPCKYLKGKICTIYDDRPEACRSYPHTHKERFISRTLFMISHYEICPIIYNVMEHLKKELGYRY